MRLVDSLRELVDPDDPTCRDPEFIRSYALPFFRWIDGLWQLWDQPYKQCLHDKWPGTVVIKVVP